MQRLPDPLEWLAAGVPLSLLIDVFAGSEPDSADIFAVEPGDASWLTPSRQAA